jgi:hypothetical protein
MVPYYLFPGETQLYAPILPDINWIVATQIHFQLKYIDQR